MSDSNQESSIGLDIESISAELKIRPEIYLKIVKSFANSLGDKMKHLNNAIAVNDHDQMRMILHEIKGTAGNLRLASISSMESVMHTAVKGNESAQKLNQCYEDLRKESEKLQHYIASINAE